MCALLAVHWCVHTHIHTVTFTRTHARTHPHTHSHTLTHTHTHSLSLSLTGDQLGWNSQPTRMVIMEDVRVPVTNILGAVGLGFAIAMKGMC